MHLQAIHGPLFTIVQRTQSRLGGSADFLNYGEKLQLVKTVLASMPIFFMCCFDVPVTIKEQVVKYVRHWRKKNSDVQANGSTLVAWKKYADKKIKVVLEFLIWKFKIKPFC
jgi:hypothetical protein